MENKFLATSEGQYLMKTVEFLIDKGYNVIYIALFGAQNYNLQREESDYDYKAVVVPSLKDMVYNSKPISLTIDLPFNGQVDVKDVRLMIDQWKKGAPNFLELLYSDWYWIHPDYSPLYWFRLNREKIAHANEESAIKSLTGQIKGKFDDLLRPSPAQIEEINRFGYASKQLSHEMRFLSMLSQYKKIPYEALLNPFKGGTESSQKFWDTILSVKKRSINYSADAAVDLGKRISDIAYEWYEKYKAEGLNYDEALLNKMDEQKFIIIKRALEAELRGGVKC